MSKKKKEKSEVEEIAPEETELEGEVQELPTQEDIENEEAQQEAVDEEDNVNPNSGGAQSNAYKCPKCHAVTADIEAAKEGIMHVSENPETHEVTYKFYCPKCALSWLHRAGAELVKA